MPIICHESNPSFHDTYPGLSVSRQSFAVSGAILAPHWHERMELWYVEEGTLTVSCDDELFDAQAGDVVIINPGQVHSFKSLSATVVYFCYILDITPYLYTPYSESCHQLRDIVAGKLRFQHIVRHHKEIKTLLLQISNAAQTGQDPLMATGLTLQLLSSMLTHCIAHRSFRHHEQLQTVNKLLEYIHNHYQDNLNLNQLAAVACLSPSYLCRRFKDAVGEAPMAYLTTVRINKAYELLSTGRYSVAEACSAVGIVDSNNFTRLFRKRVGISPKEAKPSANR